MDSLWTTYGLPMDYLWTTYGLPMDYLWTTYGTTPPQHRSNTVPSRSIRAHFQMTSRVWGRCVNVIGE